MKFVIKNVKHLAARSEETHCFSATVWIDGKRAFGVSNGGHGGPNEYFPVDKKTYVEVWKWVEKIDAELGKETITSDAGWTVKNGLDIVIGELVNKFLTERDAKRLLRTKIVYRKNNEVYTLRGLKPTPQNLAGVQRAKWWTEDHTLMNGKPVKQLAELL